MKLSTLLKWATVILIAMVFIESQITTHATWALASTWHISTDGSDITGDGSEANPFATIQHGIGMASNGDTVLVHPGVYKENINFNGKNIVVGSLFVTTGDEDYILQTVINGNRSDHVVTFANGEDATARLSGFTITNGYAHGTSAPGSSGGGIHCLNSNPTLTHLKVSGNEAVDEGGGLYFGLCSSTVQDVIITNNLAGGGGGGIRYSYGSVNLENVIVAHNSARIAGAGIQFYHADGTIRNALIADNSGGEGGGSHFDGCSPIFINVTVVGNWAAGHGGGLNVSFASQPTLVNSIVWGNSPEQIYFDTNWPGEAVTIEYSDIQGGAAGIVTNGQGPVYWGNGNMDASPRFTKMGLGNYHLANDSPAINAGKVAGAPPTDIEGNPRPNPAGSNPDMGAYENPLGLKVHLPIVTMGATINVAPGPALQVPRAHHTATRLSNGKILLVGGSRAPDDHLAWVELFDPTTGLTTQVAPLHTPRHDHSATLLLDGRVLVVGGYSAQQGWLSDAEVYDPVTNTWTVVPPQYSHGHSHTATLMKDGRVLVVGGSIGSWLCTERAEIFNPRTNSWTEAPSLPTERYGQTADLLNDGRVLVAGGHNARGLTVGGDAFVFDPRAGSWTATGSMVTQRAFAESVQFRDGRVFVAGGAASNGAPVIPVLANAEIYDPASNMWTAAAPLANARYGYILGLFSNGQVLAVGGARNWVWSENSFVREIEVYDPAADRWHTVGELPRPGAYAAAALLRDNRLWVTGGQAGQAGETFWSDTWLLSFTRTP